MARESFRLCVSKKTAHGADVLHTERFSLAKGGKWDEKELWKVMTELLHGSFGNDVLTCMKLLKLKVTAHHGDAVFEVMDLMDFGRWLHDRTR